MQRKTIVFFALIVAARALATGAEPCAVRGTAKWPPARQQAAANTRVKVADAAVGRRDSYGLMYDPKGKLVWAMDLFSRPHVLALDRAASDVVPLE
jgi:hypothetical protein